MSSSIFDALIGGLLIGSAVSLMLWLNGRVTGISGIIYGMLSKLQQDGHWRWYFASGLILGGIVFRIFNPSVFSGDLPTPTWSLAIAGFLVGLGTVLGSGCTSGHGVCGMSRLSYRSIVATFIFILSGVLTVLSLRLVGVIS